GVATPRNPATVGQGREAARGHGGSWWEDWAKGAGRRAGRRVEPPPMGSERYPAIADAPGTYIRGYAPPFREASGARRSPAGKPHRLSRRTLPPCSAERTCSRPRMRLLPAARLLLRPR